MRERASKSDGTAGKAEVCSRGLVDGGNRKLAGEELSGDQPSRHKLLKVLEKNSGSDAGISLPGVGKPASLQAAVQNLGKERGIIPPALPMPIASFHI
jgi:hypothetical protein